MTVRRSREKRMPAYSPPSSPMIASPAALVEKLPSMNAPRATFSYAKARDETHTPQSGTESETESETQTANRTNDDDTPKRLRESRCVLR
jgi:hypothetical protein